MDYTQLAEEQLERSFKPVTDEHQQTVLMRAQVYAILALVEELKKLEPKDIKFVPVRPLD